MFNDWIQDRGFPPIITVRNDGKYVTLEKNCLEKKMLPSLAYGFKSCQDKYKRRPQDKFVDQWEPAREAWRSGVKVRKAIGYDADETHRPSIPSDDKYQYEYPLRAWDWGRKECSAAIVRHGLPLPPKSSCFFCPATTKPEIIQLAVRYPDLMARAVAMEKNAEENLGTVKGLGRRFSWTEHVAVYCDDLSEMAGEMFGIEDDTDNLPCGCYDGCPVPETEKDAD